jgi:hypothetical protein
VKVRSGKVCTEYNFCVANACTKNGTGKVTKSIAKPNNLCTCVTHKLSKRDAFASSIARIVQMDIFSFIIEATFLVPTAGLAVSNANQLQPISQQCPCSSHRQHPDWLQSMSIRAPLPVIRVPLIPSSVQSRIAFSEMEDLHDIEHQSENERRLHHLHLLRLYLPRCSTLQVV